MNVSIYGADHYVSKATNMLAIPSPSVKMHEKLIWHTLYDPLLKENQDELGNANYVGVVSWDNSCCKLY